MNSFRITRNNSYSFKNFFEVIWSYGVKNKNSFSMRIFLNIFVIQTKGIVII